MAKNTLPPDAPAWLTKDRQIKEVVYCCEFLSRHPMKCIHGKFFTVDGLVSDEGSLKQEIFDDISEWKETGVARKVEDLLKSIRMMAYAEDIPLHYDRIHVSNGTWFLDGHFSEDKEYCREYARLHLKLPTITLLRMTAVFTEILPSLTAVTGWRSITGPSRQRKPPRNPLSCVRNSHPSKEIRICLTGS